MLSAQDSATNCCFTPIRFTRQRSADGVAPHHRELDRRRSALRPQFPRAFIRVCEWRFPLQCTAGPESAIHSGRWHWRARRVKNAATTLDLLAGANYTHESYSAFTLPPAPPGGTPVAAGEPQPGGLDAGGCLHSKRWGRAQSSPRAFSLPRPQRYVAIPRHIQFGTVTKLSKWLGWQNSFGDIYVSNPPTGTKKNDLQIATGLNFSFTH